MKTRIKRLISFVCMMLVFVTAFVSDAMAAEARLSAADRVIRVSCPIQSGFFERDENGNYSGYTYEYLMKIAQRTGWKYEFDVYEPTNENLEAGLTKLQNGECDLMGSMVYNEALAQSYEFTSVSYGVTNYILMADENNQTVNERTYYNSSDLRVVIVENAVTTNDLFNSFCEEKGITYQPVYVSSTKEGKQMVKDGKADVFISKDVIQSDGFKTVIKFASQPFYFASTKGNTELTDEISRLITEIDNSDPYFVQKLHEKYFKRDSDYQLSFTEDELDYLENTPTVRMIVLTGKAPIEDYNAQNGTYSGIIVDIMKKMTAESGMQIEFVPADSLEQAKQMLADGEADVFAGFPYDYSSAENYGVLLTSPIFSMPVVRISNINGQSKNDGFLVSSSIKLFDGEQNVRYVDDISEVLDLVDSGEYKEAYVNGYLAQHYAAQKNYPNIQITQTPYSNYELCLGVRESADLRLVGVLEQMISKIKSSEIEDVVYQNTVVVRSQSLWDMVLRSPAEFLVPVLIILVVIAALLLVLFFKTKRLNKMISKEKSRYQKISTLDRLAQTYNNDAFKQLSRAYLSGEDGIPSGAFCICDIDSFKAINDTYGHLMGDDVIRSLGELLITLFRGDDLVGRLGGDEFVMLMKGTTDRTVIANRCEEILSRCKTLCKECEITLSIGIAVFDGCVSFDEVFKAADSALYNVKNQGKNGFEILPELLKHS